MTCHPDCIRAIAHADMIVFCPGSFLTGIISALLTRGIQTALRVSPAMKVQVVNIMTHAGQTDGMSARDHIEAFAQYLGIAPDVALVNTARPPERWLKSYRKEGAEPVRLDVAGLRETRIVAGDFLEPAGKDVLTLYERGGRGMLVGSHFIRHDPAKLGKALLSVLRARPPKRRGTERRFPAPRLPGA